MASKYSKRDKREYAGWRAALQYFIIYFILYPFFKIFFLAEINGRENIPENEAIISTSNHQSYLDPVIMCLATKRPVAFMAKEELFKVPVLSPIIQALGAFSVNRKKLEISTIKTAKGVMSTDFTLGMFPEGTRTKDLNKVGKVHKGFVFLAKSTKAKVLPIGVILKRGICPCFGKLIVNIGKPLEVPENSDELMNNWGESISQLTGREYIKQDLSSNAKPVGKVVQ